MSDVPDFTRPWEQDGPTPTSYPKGGNKGKRTEERRENNVGEISDKYINENMREGVDEDTGESTDENTDENTGQDEDQDENTDHDENIEEDQEEDDMEDATEDDMEEDTEEEPNDGEFICDKVPREEDFDAKVQKIKGLMPQLETIQADAAQISAQRRQMATELHNARVLA